MGGNNSELYIEAKKAQDSESYLSITSAGIAVNGITNAITGQVNILSTAIGSGYSSSNTVGSHITSLESTISSCVLIDKSNLEDAGMAYSDTAGNVVIYNPGNNTIKSTTYGISNDIALNINENGQYYPGAGATGNIATEEAVINYVKGELTWQEIPDEEEP